MTILVTADLHLNSNPRDEYRHKFQTHLRELVKKHHVECVLLLGDLCDEKDHHAAGLVNQVMDHLHQLSRLCPVVVLKGNHDYTSEGAIPYFAFSSLVEGVTWVGVVTASPGPKGALPEAVKNLGRVLFLPHTHDYAREWGGTDFAKYDWVFMHNTVAKAAHRGRQLDGLPTSIFGDTPVISGDIHSPQLVGPVIYVGAPYTVDFGDDYEPRVILIKNNKVTSISTDAQPQKRLVRIDMKTGRDKDDLARLHTGDIVKIRVTLYDGDYAKWAEIKREHESRITSQKCIVHMVQPVMSDAARRMSKRRAKATAPKSDREVLENYAQRRNIDERTTKVGLNLLETT